MERRAQRRRREAAPKQRAEPRNAGRRASERPQPRCETRPTLRDNGPVALSFLFEMPSAGEFRLWQPPALRGADAISLRMDMRKLVGRNAARLRQAAGLTQEQLAGRSGLSQQYLSDLERGKLNPTVLTLYELAEALGGRRGAGAARLNAGAIRHFD